MTMPSHLNDKNVCQHAPNLITSEGVVANDGYYPNFWKEQTQSRTQIYP